MIPGARVKKALEVSRVVLWASRKFGSSGCGVLSGPPEVRTAVG